MEKVTFPPTMKTQQKLNMPPKKKKKKIFIAINDETK